MDTTSLNIDLPEPLKVFVEIEAQEGGYVTASDYIRALIREAEHRKSEQAVESLLLEGLGSTDRGTMNDIEWESHKQQYRAQRLEMLRTEIAGGLDDAARGAVLSSHDVFQRLAARNQQATSRR